jgi:GAF domain-containing protein
MQLLDQLSSFASVDQALSLIAQHFGADSGTVHFLAQDGQLHLAASSGLPPAMLPVIREIPVGKGMAGLAVQRRKPIDACNIQTDGSGDIRPGAKATGLEGAIVVPIFRGQTVIGALGIANRHERVFSADEQELLIRVGRLLAQAKP